MKGAAGLALIAVAVGAAMVKLPEADTAPIQAAPVARGFAYELAGGTARCALRIASEDGSATPISFDDGCGELVADAALFWRTREDGGVDFANGEGNAVLEFGPSDGAAYETFRRGQPLLSLTPLD